MIRTIIILFFFTYCSSMVSAQWITQISGTSNHLTGLDAIDGGTAYIVGDFYTFRKTTNGGQNWMTIPFPDQSPSCCSFLNSNTGLVSAGGRVNKTTNGGISWLYYSTNITPISNVKFVNDNWAYACSYEISRSTDGGVNWQTLANHYPYYFKEIFFTDSITGTIVGENGLILTTTNGGLNWTQRIIYLPVQFGDSTIFSVKYVNSLSGFACGNNGIFLKTTNAGSNWIYLSTGTITQFHKLCFIDLNKGFMAGSGGVIYMTTNGGINWTQQATGITDPLNCIDFVDASTGWACGFNGKVLKTTNGGITFANSIHSEIPGSYSLSQNYPNPFNPSTKISYDLPVRGFVKLVIYDVLGREVKTLANEKQIAGTYEINWDGSNSPSGVYFYKLQTGDYTQTRKMLLIK